MNHGHFGKPSTTATIAVAAALLGYWLLPFGVVDYRGPANFEDDILLWGEVAQDYGSVPDALVPLSSSLTFLVSGLIIAAVGVLILTVLGRQPLDVDMARWMGAAGGAVTVLGSTLALLPAMAHVGTGFATFLGTVTFTEFRFQFWAISPVLIAAGCLVAIHQGLIVMTMVSANRDGIRDQARMHADGVRYAALFLAAVMFVPWSIGMLPDGISDQLGIERLGDDAAPLFFSAQDVLGANPAELQDGARLRYSGADDWGLLKLSLTMMQTAAYIGITISLLGTLVGTARSVGMPDSLARSARGLTAVTLLAWLGATVFYLVAWFTFKPRDVDDLFLPGFLPILVAIVGGLAVRAHWRIFQDNEEASNVRTAIA